MKKRSLFLSMIFFSFFLSNNIFSQKNYQPGYIIDSNGDTINGLIDYKNWEKNPETISFRKSTATGEMVFNPSEIKGFFAAGEFYVSAVVHIDNSPYRTNELSYLRTPQDIVDTVFLQVLVKGEKSLFYLRYLRGKEHFYINENNDFQLLILNRYLQDRNGKTMVAKDERYKGQLKIYFQDCPSIHQKISNLEYNSKRLIKIFLDYVECTQSKTEYHKPLEKVKIEVGIMGGLSLTTLSFSSAYNSYKPITSASYSISKDPSVGLFFDVILPRKRGKWSICNELLYTNYNVKGDYLDYTNENDYTKVYTTIKSNHFKINNLLRFKYPIGQIYLYANAGISNGWALSVSHLKTQEIRLYSSLRVIESDMLRYITKFEQGYMFGLGGKYKRYSFELRYQKTDGISGIVTLSSVANRYSVFFGYRF